MVELVECGGVNKGINGLEQSCPSRPGCLFELRLAPVNALKR